MRTLRSSKSTKMKQIEVNKYLPDHLIEEIIVRMPFPTIFKARALSKSLRSRFLPVSSIDDEESKVLATGFQKLVLEWSKHWKTFSPVSIGTKTRSFGYDRESQTWRRLPALSFLPKNLDLLSSSLQIEGALLCVFVRPLLMNMGAETSFNGNGSYRGQTNDEKNDAQEIQVRNSWKQLLLCNILTGSWRVLPHCPRACTNDFERGHVWITLVSLAVSKYQIILVCEEMCRPLWGRRHYSAQIYDSESDLWIVKKMVITDTFRVTSAAYLSGVLYIHMAGTSQLDPHKILTFNLQDQTLHAYELPPIDSQIGFNIHTNHCRLVACNGSLLMTATVYRSGLRILEVKVDSGSPMLLLLSQETSPMHLGDTNLNFLFPVTNYRAWRDGNSINFLYYNQIHVDRASRYNWLIGYDYNLAEWKFSEVPVAPWGRKTGKWSLCSVEPGLNTFAAV